MWYFYIAILGIIAYLTNEQRDADNWDALRIHYKELRELKEKNYDN